MCVCGGEGGAGRGGSIATASRSAPSLTAFSVCERRCIFQWSLEACASDKPQTVRVKGGAGDADDASDDDDKDSIDEELGRNDEDYIRDVSRCDGSRGVWGSAVAVKRTVRTFVASGGVCVGLCSGGEADRPYICGEWWGV
jgi:hypothetical protein